MCFNFGNKDSQSVQRLSFAQAATQCHFWRQDFSLFEFMHYFLEKLIMLIMKIEKHPVAMQIPMHCDLISAGFFFFLYKTLEFMH